MVGRCALISAIAALGCSSSSGSGPRVVTESAPTVTDIAGPRGGFEITRDRAARGDTIDFPSREVWRAVAPVFARLNFGAESADSTSMVFVTRNTLFRRSLGGVRMSTYVGCGVSALGNTADRYPVFLKVTTTVRDGAPGTSVVYSQVQAVARPEDNGASPVSCESNGRLERQISRQLATSLLGAR